MGFDLTPEIMGNARFNNNVLGRFNEFIRKLETNGYPVVSTFRPHPSVTSMSFAYSGYRDKDMGTPLCGDGIVNMYHAYENSYVSGVPEIGPNVTDMENAFAARLEWNDTTESYDCYPNITEGKSGPNVTIMDNAYEGCIHLTRAEVGDKVTNMYCAYQGCNNLTSAACGPNVKNMDRAYLGCTNIDTAVCGPNVVNMESTYRSCYNLTTAVCGDNVVNMDGAYAGCTNIVTAVCGPNVVSMQAAYTGCFNLTTAACGDKVTDEGFVDAFIGCENLKTAACGNSITSLNNYYNADMYPEFKNLTTAACGTNVTDMSNAYKGCTALTKAVIGDNVTKFDNAYDGCGSLTELGMGVKMNADAFWSVYGASDLSKVTKISGNVNWVDNSAPLYSYFYFRQYPQLLSSGLNIFNITDMPEEPMLENGDRMSIWTKLIDNSWPYEIAWCWDNCTNMCNAFCGYVTDRPPYLSYPIYNIKTAVCGPNVVNMHSAYSNCSNLTTAVCGPNVVDMSSTYSNCSNLTTAVCGDNVVDMSNVYRNCVNLTTAVCGDNVVNMSNAYYNCPKITTPVIGDKVEYIAYAYVNSGVTFKTYCDFINSLPDEQFRNLGGVYAGYSTQKSNTLIYVI